ncbi:MAG: hypothetical protein U1E39_16670 [Planctomycetota bacterium]
MSLPRLLARLAAPFRRRARTARFEVVFLRRPAGLAFDAVTAARDAAVGAGAAWWEVLQPASFVAWFLADADGPTRAAACADAWRALAAARGDLDGATVTATRGDLVARFDASGRVVARPVGEASVAPRGA